MHSRRVRKITQNPYCKRLYLLEAISLTLKKQITIDQTIAILAETSNAVQAIEEIIVESLWLNGIDWSKSDTPADYKAQYSLIINKLIESKLVKSRTLLERLDESTLEGCGLIVDSQQFTRKRIRINTKNIYEQQKYNLLREESEGYAKVITTLTQLITADNYKSVISDLQSLIGYFDLDPNRVLDITLEAFEADYENQCYLSILPMFNRIAITQILGFKFQNFSKSPDSLRDLIEEDITPISLYRITAILISAEFIDIQDIWPHLSPDEKEFEAISKKKLKLSLNIAQRARVVKLIDNTDERKKEKEKEKQDHVEVMKESQNNQKLWILEELVKLNEWSKVEMMYYYQKNYFDISLHRPLLTAICEFADWVIEPLYRPISASRHFHNYQYPKRYPEKDVKQCHSFSEFMEFLIRLVKITGPFICRSVLLYVKICKILKEYYSKSSQQECDNIATICTEILMPGLTLMKSNPYVVNELWTLLLELNAYKRYLIYENCLLKAYYSHPLLIVKYASIVKETNKWHKRVAKENVRAYGKVLAKLSHNNPTLVFDSIIMYVQSYENQIPSIINSLGYSTNMSLDVIAYIILRHISSGRDLLGADGNIAEWMSNLCTLTGLLFKKYNHIDIYPLLEFLEGCLLKGRNVEMNLLVSILTNLSGWNVLDLNQISDKQLEYQCGEYYLKIESTDMPNDLKRKKTAHILCNLLLESKNSIQIDKTLDEGKQLLLSLPISSRMQILLAKSLEETPYNSFYSDTKMVGSTCDRIYSILKQLNDILTFLTCECNIITETKMTEKPSPITKSYTELLPQRPFESLMKHYAMSPECIFFIARPTIPVIGDLAEKDFDLLCDEIKSMVEHWKAHLQSATKQVKSVYMIEASYTHTAINSIWDFITPMFYSIFWLSKLQDLVFPDKLYDNAIEKNVSIISMIKGDRVNEGSQIHKKKEKNCKASEECLKNEKQKHMESFRKYNEFMERNKERMFAVSCKDNTEVCWSFVQVIESIELHIS